jgi:hypothetical protein
MNEEEQSNSGIDSNSPTNEAVAPLTTESLAEMLRGDLAGDTQDTSTAEDDNNEAEAHEEASDSEGSEPVAEDGEEVPSQTEEQNEDQAEDLPRGVKKRIDKLTAKRKQAEAEIERLKSELEDLKNKPAEQPLPIVRKDNPYAHLDSPDKIRQEMEKARKVRYWAEENSDGCVVTNQDGSETEYSASQVREIKLNALKALDEHLPQQAAFITEKVKMDTYAESEYSWWKKKEARERQIADNFIKAFPEITKFPDYKVVVGDYIAGFTQREAKIKGNTAGKVVKAPVVPKSTSAPANLSQRDLNAKESKQRFLQTTKSEDLADYLKSIL